MKNDFNRYSCILPDEIVISIQIHSLVDYTKLEFKMKKKKKITRTLNSLILHILEQNRHCDFVLFYHVRNVLVPCTQLLTLLIVRLG